LRGAFALPVVIGERVLGAIEFFSRDARKPDPWLLQIALSVGRQIGQLMVRREAEAALRDSEARFRSLTELSSDWFWEQDEDMRFTTLSIGFNSALGIDPATLIGKHRWDAELVGISAGSPRAHRETLSRGSLPRLRVRPP
jgi:PAS domain-containing protein